MSGLPARLRWPRLTAGRVLWTLAAVLCIASYVTPASGWHRPVTVRRADLPTLQHAIFIRADGRAAGLVDERGQLIDVTSLVFHLRPELSRDSLERRVEFLQDSARSSADSLVQPSPNYDYGAYLQGLMKAIDQSPKKHILLWIHGGRNSLVDSPDRTLALAESLETTDFFPIRVNWQGSDVTSYWSHLTYARPARRRFIEKAYVALKAPLLVVLDLGRGLVRTPLAMYYDVARTWTSFFCDRRRARVRVDQLSYSRGAAADGARRYYEGIWSLVSLPIRAIPTILINAFGPGEWQSLRHSTQQMFQTDADMRRTRLPLRHRHDTGALSQFADSLSEHLRLHPEKDLTIVGHSMGTMIACELMRHEPWPIGNVVFMAAACSVHDLYDVIVPVLESNPSARFYNLTLHEANDIDETGFPVLGDLLYRGSLLTWIDDFLGSTETPLERTLGRDENAVTASRLIPDEVRTRVVLKSFGRNDPDEERRYGPHGVPQAHGDFSDPRMRFWRDAFWGSDPAPPPPPHP